MNKVDRAWKTQSCIHRHPANPILQARDLPYPATLVFNCGVCKFQGRYVMVIRNDLGDATAKTLNNIIHLGLAFSDDGIRWTPAPKPFNAERGHPLYNAYDPRITVLDGRLYLCFASGCFVGNDWRGTLGGVAVTDDLEHWEVLNVSVPDNRNMVIFPERFGGKILRLERPFAGYLRPGDPFDIWISASPDGRYWGESQILLNTSQLAWVNDKIGPGAPPVKTPQGWLTFIHGVDRDPSRKWGWEGNWGKRYSGGLMLLDLENPRKVIGLAPFPVLVPEPEYDYEAHGYRDYVIFPGGAILEDSGEVKIYYGSADTVECLATAHVDDLLNLCKSLPD